MHRSYPDVDFIFKMKCPRTDSITIKRYKTRNCKTKTFKNQVNLTISFHNITIACLDISCCYIVPLEFFLHYSLVLRAPVLGRHRTDIWSFFLLHTLSYTWSILTMRPIDHYEQVLLKMIERISFYSGCVMLTAKFVVHFILLNCIWSAFKWRGGGGGSRMVMYYEWRRIRPHAPDRCNQGTRGKRKRARLGEAWRPTGEKELPELRVKSCSKDPTCCARHRSM